MLTSNRPKHPSGLAEFIATTVEMTPLERFYSELKRQWCAAANGTGTSRPSQASVGVALGYHTSSCPSVLMRQLIDDGRVIVRGKATRKIYIPNEPEFTEGL